jgi:Spy/CpxP family protein refolding chaperone
MDNMLKNKWQVRLAAVVIFLLGAAAGALAFNAYQSWVHAGTRGGGPGHFEEVFDRLKLTDEQKAQVHQILSDAREQIRAAHREAEPRMAEIRRQTDERLQKTLTPEQWQQFQKVLEEMHERRGRGRRGGDRPRSDEQSDEH